jgi:hypothetical protein
VRNDQMRLIELLMFVWVRGVIDVEFESEVCVAKSNALLSSHTSAKPAPFHHHNALISTIQSKHDAVTSLY